MLQAVNTIVPTALSIIGVACFIIAVVLALPLRILNLRRTAAIAGVGALALVMTRLPDITLLDALGIRTELRQTLNEANATIAQLRKLAVAISEPELSALAMSGVIFHQLRFTDQYNREKRIVDILKSLGVSQDDITVALQIWKTVTLRKLSNVITVAIGETDKQLAEKFAGVRIDAHENPVKPDVLRKFLSDNHVTDKAVVELVDDYERLFETGEVRRPEVFPVGIEP